MKSGNLIMDLSFQFSVNVMSYTEKLNSERKYELAKQLFRSGTSIGANIREAQFADSKNDFIHKLKIAEKEAAETEYWLLLCKEAGYDDPTILLQNVDHIKKVLGKIIRSSKYIRNKANMMS